MRRILTLLAVVTLMALLGYKISGNSGTVTIFWQDYRLDSSVGFFAAVTAIVVLSLFLAIQATRFVVALPFIIQTRRSLQNEKRGMQLLTEAWVALTLSDDSNATKLLERAQKKLTDTPLPLLLAVQLAKRQGKEVELDHLWQRLRNYPETSLLAGKGLIEAARKRGDNILAVQHAERLFKDASGQAWLVKTLLDLYIDQQRWDEAVTLVNVAARKHRYSRQEKKHLLALIDYAHAKVIHRADGSTAALSFYEKAHKHSHAFVPAALDYAQLLCDQDKPKDAKKVIERSWKESPHPALLERYRQCFVPKDIDKCFRNIDAMVNTAVDRHAARLAAGKLALADRRFDLARTYIEGALNEKETSLALRLMGELAFASKRNQEEERDYLTRSLKASADNAWICDDCGHVETEWSFHCAECKSFDSFKWGVPSPKVQLAGRQKRLVIN